VHPQTDYAKSGDVHVAYQVLGDEPVELVFVPGFVSHVEHFWEDPSLARFLRRLASFCLIHRAHYQSGWDEFSPLRFDRFQ
jgi:hypothetical protein